MQSVAIHRDSSIDLRGLPHAVVLPRLELFADAGFPFTEWPDLGRTAVVLPNAPTIADDEAVLELAGFFGAQTGAPATSIVVTDAGRVDTVRDRDLILLGAPPAQPLLSAWTANVPLESGVDRVGVNPNPIPPRWLHPEWPFREADRGRLASLLAARPRIDLIVEQFVSPFRSDRSVVAIVPGSSYGTMSGLLRPAVRNGPVYGGVALALAGQFQSFLVGNTDVSLRRSAAEPARDRLAVRTLSAPAAVCGAARARHRPRSPARHGTCGSATCRGGQNVTRGGWHDHVDSSDPVHRAAAGDVLRCSCADSRRRRHPVEQGAIARSARPDGSGRAELESGAPGQSEPDRSAGGSGTPREAERRRRGAAPVPGTPSQD